MKKLCFALYLFLLGTIFWLGFVYGDIIDVWTLATTEVEDSCYLQWWGCIKYIYQTYEVYSVLKNIKSGLLVLCALFIVSFVFLCLVFRKIWEKWWKSLIPYYNVYLSFKLVWIKKWIFFVLLPFLLLFILRETFTYWLSASPCWLSANCTIPDDWTYPGSYIDGSLKWTYYYSSLVWISDFVIDVIYVVILWLFSCLMFMVYYRLFRKFGWNKCYSVLWTMFFPIWVCILWLGNFQCQWNEEDKKEKN